MININNIKPEDVNPLKEALEFANEIIRREEARKLSLDKEREFANEIIDREKSKVSWLDKEIAIIEGSLESPSNQSQQIIENDPREFTTTNKIIVDSIKQKASSRVNMLCECQRLTRGLEQQDPIILGQCCSGYSEQTYSREKNEECININ